MNLTDKFVENLYNFSKRDFTKEEEIHAKKCLLDYLGVTVAGAKAYHEVESTLLGTCLAEGGNSIVIGHPKKSSVPVAALINGISAHAVELDDGQRFGNVHPGAPVISALLSVAEHDCLSISSIWKGLLTGYECTLRLACSIQPSHKLKGFHATGPCGTVGATMAIAAMLNYSKEQFKAALSVACTSASGILEMIEGDTQLMPYNSGKAASNAVVAAFVGLSNFKYPEDALGGKRGFLNCFSDHPSLDILTDFSDKTYCTTNYFKIYAACGHCHASIDAALNLRKEHNFSVDEIESVDIQTYQLALRGHDHNVIDGVNSARMSIPYSTAVALVHGSADIEDFDEHTIGNQQLLQLTSKITVRENVELTKQAPAKRIAIVSVHTNKDDFTETITFPKGQPENPLSLDDIESKFRKYTAWGGMTKDAIDRVFSMIIQSDKEHNVKELMDCFK